MNREQLFFELEALEFNTECLQKLPDADLYHLLQVVKYLTFRKTHAVDEEAGHEMILLEGMKVCPICRAKVVLED